MVVSQSAQDRHSNSRRRTSISYLFAELFGGATDKSRFLMISDGGHFENLAAYELVKSGCRVIIVSDAECDPDLKFEGLGTLIRMCEVDFNARIVVDVEAIRRGQNPLEHEGVPSDGFPTPMARRASLFI